MARRKEKVFIEITNHDIWKKMQSYEKKLDCVEDKLDECLIHVKQTNGKVKRHEKLIYAFGAILLIIIVSTAPQYIPFLLSLL